MTTLPPIEKPVSFAPIPISAGERIAKTYGYDQVVIIARAVGEGGGEHVTTYGRDPANCAVAAKIGDFLKHKVMGWTPEPEDTVAAARRADHKRLREALSALRAVAVMPGTADGRIPLDHPVMVEALAALNQDRGV